MTAADPSALLELAIAVARDAGDLLRSYADRRSLTVDHKTSHTDPVSEADHASERLITDRILAARPDDGIMGEEAADDRAGTSGLTWVVDPLDGTVNFLYGIAQWCVSVACADDTGSLVGAVYDPSHDECFAAARGGGAHVDGTPLQVSDPPDLGRTLVATGFAYDRGVRVDQGRLVADLLADVRDIRRGGSAALDLCGVAAGRLDAYAEFGLAPWDWAAGRLIVEEAGGVVSTLTRRLGDADRDGIVAGGRRAHDGLQAWLLAHGAAPVT